MIIENPDALKQWLTGYLPPLCDADPEVLAKYCLALVRKDRPNSELRASMLEQLDVFLKGNTESFVDKFLQVAKTKAYLPKETSPTPAPVTTTSSTIEKDSSLTRVSGHSPDSTTSSSNPITTATTTPTTATTNVVTTANSNNDTNDVQPPLPPLPPPSATIPHPPPETTPPYPPPPAKKEEVSSSNAKPRKNDLDRDNEEKVRRRPRSRSRSPRERSRSRTRERDRSHRRSRSRGRSTRSKYDDRRRRSPHKRYRRSRTRSRSRSPRWSRSPPPRRSRSRNRLSLSPRPRGKGSLSPPKRIRHRSRSPTSHKHGSLSPGKSPSKGHDNKDDSPPPSERSTVSSAIVQSVVSIPNSQEHFTCKSQRCRDYDEQGFCMRGDQCPYDHGSDPVVLEGGALDFTPVGSFGYPIGPSSAPPLPQDTRALIRHPPPPRQSQFEYTPNNPSLWSGDNINNPPPFYGRGRGINNGPRFPGHQLVGSQAETGRELINVPVSRPGEVPIIRTSLAQRLGPATVHYSTSNSFNRSSSQKYGPPSVENMTLELRKVPSALNTISHLNQHFSKFGVITNIQVHHDGDAEAALVTFSSHAEASAAYRSTEAVLNNRFIKLFWHYSDKQPSKDLISSMPPRIPFQDRSIKRDLSKSHKFLQADSNIPEKNEKVFVSRGSLVKTVYNLSALQIKKDSPDSLIQSQTRVQASLVPDSTQQSPSSQNLEEIKRKEREAIEKQQELLRAEIAAKNKEDKKKADAAKLKQEVERRKNQLLDKQIQQVKVLLNKLENNKSIMKPEEINSLLNTIKSLQSAIDTTKASMVSAISPAVAKPAPQKSKAQLDKEILDTELELYTVQSEGGDISRLKLQLNNLKKQCAFLRGGKTLVPHVGGSLKFSPPYTSGRGRFNSVRGVRGRGRGGRGAYVYNTVDRRTASINASGFEREDKDEVLAHFGTLGTVANYQWDGQTPAITVTYSSRREAEKAMTEGRNLGDRLLTLTWVSNPIPSGNIIKDYQRSPSYGSSSTAAAPHSTTSLLSQEDGEEITEEIVEVEESVDGEDDATLLFEEADEEDEEGGGRSWRR